MLQAIYFSELDKLNMSDMFKNIVKKIELAQNYFGEVGKYFFVVSKDVPQ